MDDDIFHTILFAVGSLPFWTGERKLKQFLRGDPGSFWEDPPPLKPTYLEHYFFGGLDDRDNGDITRAIQRLKQTDYLKKERLSQSLPHQVIKLTSQGVFQYYNLIVTEKEIESPTWWIHHIAQIDRKPQAPIKTGGEILPFSEKLHLTQTPGFVENDQRIKDEGTIRLVGEVENKLDVEPGQSVLLENVVPRVDKGVLLALGPPTEVRTVPANDLRRNLTHFQSTQTAMEHSNPYVLKGTLSGRERTEPEGILTLLIENEHNEITLKVPPQNIDSEEELKEGDEYVFGPVKRSDDGDELTLRPNGEIQRTENF